MKKRIYSLLITLVAAVSVVLGTSIFASADNSDGLKSSAISLAENVTLKMEVAISAPSDGAYAKITLPNGDVDTTQLVATAPKNGDNFVFFAKVAVKDLAKDVTIEICNVDGSTLVAADTTSALAYCDAYTEGEFTALVGALKAYATAADVYFDEDKTADSAPAADFSKVANIVTSGTLPAGITHRSATLLLESETTIRHYFELAEGKSIDAYTFFVDANANGKCDNGEALTPSTKSTKDGTTVYYVDIKGLTPNQLDNAYTVAVTDGGDTTYTCDYGVLTYAKRAYESGDLKAKNLAAALLAYSNEAGKLTGTITFNTDGGSAVEAQTYEYGVTTAVSANTTKNGFTLIGWFDEYGNRVTSIPASSTGNITLNAKWGATYFNEQFNTDVSTPITAAGTIGGLSVNGSNGASSFTVEDGHLTWAATGKYATVSPSNNSVREASSDVITITLVLARANGAIVPHIDYRFRANNGSNSDINVFTINTNDNNVKANGTEIIKIPEVKDGYVTLKVVFDFSSGLVSFYNASNALIYSYTPNLPSGYTSFAEFRSKLVNNAPNLYVSGYKSGADSILYVDFYEIREGGVN